MLLLWLLLGSANFSHSQLAMAHEASAALSQMHGMQALEIWEELEKQLPDAPAVYAEMLNAADYEIGRPFHHGATLVRLQSAVERAENKITSFVQSKPDNPAFNILYTYMLHKRWRRTVSIEYNALKMPAPRPYALPKSDAHLQAMLTALAKAQTLAHKDALSKETLRQVVVSMLKSLATYAKSALAQQALATLVTAEADLQEKDTAALKKLRKDTGAISDSLYLMRNEAQTFTAVAKEIENETLATAYRARAMDEYRELMQRATAQHSPLLSDQDAADELASALLDAMFLLSEIAEKDAPNANERQKRIEESLNFAKLYLQLAPRSPDSHEGGYGLIWHYMIIAKLTAFPDKKAAYTQMARERAAFNASCYKVGPGKAFWKETLSDIEKEGKSQ